MPSGTTEKIKRRKEEIIEFLKKEPRFSFEVWYAFNLSATQFHYVVSRLIAEKVVCKRDYIRRGRGGIGVLHICGDTRFSRLECLALEVIEKYFSRANGRRMALTSKGTHLSRLIEDIMLPYLAETVKVWKVSRAINIGVILVLSMIHKHAQDAVLYAYQGSSGHVVVVDTEKLKERLRELKKHCQKDRKV